MPLASSLLLQAAPAPKAQATSSDPSPAPTAAGKDGTASFAHVFAKESGAPTKGSAAVTKGAGGPTKDSSGTTPANPHAADDKSTAAPPVVAGSGNSLPVSDKDTTADDSSDDPLLTQAAPTDPSQQIPTPAPDPAPLPPQAPSEIAPQVQAQIQAQIQIHAQMAPVVTPAAAAPTPPDDFDPHADPLDALPTVRLALEQSGHLSTTRQPQQNSSAATTDPDASSNLLAGVILPAEQKADSGGSGQGSDDSLKGLVDDGLKGLNGANADPSVDNFANHLAALTQAEVPKTVNALPPSQPLAMHQSGWTDEVVNRVLYLSSSNLKSADIQLHPAELGRLDIRVDLAANQPAQISFISGHAGVRDALEGQMVRLKDMFDQQGMGQVNVTVSDQPRGWQGSGQEQAQQQSQQRRDGSNASLEGAADEPDAAIHSAPAVSTVLGSSAVDYYA